MDEQRLREALEPFAKFGRYLLEHPRSGLSEQMYGWDNEVFICQSDVINAAKVLAALTPSAPVDERGWVVEKRGTLPVEYVCAASAGFEFTTDNLGAIRFCRREDANQVAEILDGEDVAIVEHMWCGPTPSAPTKESIMQRNDVRFSEEFGTPYYGSEIEEDAPDKLERKIKTLESNLRDLNTLYFKSLDNYNSMDEWWHKEWHQSQGIPCANDEYCPLTRRVNLPAVPSTPSAPVAEAAPPVNLRAITSHLIAIAADIARRKYVSNLEGVRTIKQAQMIIANDSDAHGRLAYDLKEIADELHKLDAAPPATKPAPAPILAELERISASIDCDAPCSQNMQALLQHLIDFIVAGKETK